MDSVFSSYDKDGDEKLDIDEFRYFCKALFRDDKGKLYTMEDTKLKEIFDVFDENRDQFIDKKEFVFCWNHWIKILLRPITLLLVCDVQNDFISGALSLINCPAKQDAAEIIAPINHILETVEFHMVAYSLDWHPHDHVSFIDNVFKREMDPSSPVTAEQAQVYDTVIFVGPVRQELWPRHCVQNTWGAELHMDLVMVENAVKVYKGTDPETDAYSAFRDKIPLGNTTFTDLLRQKRITDVFICGIAYDVCVAVTALDALSLGYRTIIIEDCTRGVNLADIELTKKTVTENSGVIVNSQQLKAMVEGTDRRPELAYKLAMELKLHKIK